MPHLFQDLFSMFILPTPEEVAKRELRHAELDLLKAQSGVEVASTQLAYQQMRVTRLRNFVNAQGKAAMPNLRAIQPISKE